MISAVQMIYATHIKDKGQGNGYYIILPEEVYHAAEAVYHVASAIYH